MARTRGEPRPGYDPTNLLQASLEPSTERFATDAARRTFSAACMRGSRSTPRSMARCCARSWRIARRSRDLRAARVAVVWSSAAATSRDARRHANARHRPHRRSCVCRDDDRSRTPWRCQPLTRGAPPGGVVADRRSAPSGRHGDTLQWRTMSRVRERHPVWEPPLTRPAPRSDYCRPAGERAAAEVIVRHRNTEVAGRQHLNEVFGAIDPLSVPGYVLPGRRGDSSPD